MKTKDLFQSTPSVWMATTSFRGKVKYFLISIHAFRVEGDRQVSGNHRRLILFQSTPSVWKATLTVSARLMLHDYFNPRLPCGRRHPTKGKPDSNPYSISIHAFRVEGDNTNFLRGNGFVLISIHAFRVEGDVVYGENLRDKLNFNPRLPCGRRPCRVRFFLLIC